MGFFLILLILFFTLASSCQASVFINEFSVQPSQAIEIFNASSMSADISGWYIDDSGGSTYMTIDRNTIIPPYTCQVFSGSFNLNSASSDMVRLFDSSYPPTTVSAHLVDQYVYVKAPSTQFSLGRFPDGSNMWQEIPQSFGYLNETGQTCLVPSPTPTPSPLVTLTPTLTLVPTPSLSPTLIELKDYDGLTIGDVFPCPEHDQKETVSIYNGNDFSVQLTHWYIDDVENAGSSPKPFDATLSPHSSFVVELAKPMLNNTGDTVRLLNADMKEKDLFEYTYCNEKTNIEELVIFQSNKTEPTIQKPSEVSTHKTVQKQLSKKAQKPVVKVQTSLPSPEVLGTTSVTIENRKTPTSNHILLFIPLSYSFLTIASLFIKMNHA